MGTNQKGFTLIELVIVIVILGILAATALPKFVDLKGDAAQAAVQGAAGALSSAAGINIGKYQITSSSAQRLSTSGACGSLAGSANTGLMGGLSGAHVAVSGTDADCTGAASGVTKSCTLNSTDDTSKTASATIICTG